MTLNFARAVCAWLMRSRCAEVRSSGTLLMRGSAQQVRMADAR